MTRPPGGRAAAPVSWATWCGQPASRQALAHAIATPASAPTSPIHASMRSESPAARDSGLGSTNTAHRCVTVSWPNAARNPGALNALAPGFAQEPGRADGG